MRFASILAFDEAAFDVHIQRVSEQERQRNIKAKDEAKGAKVILRWVLITFDSLQDGKIN